MSEFLAREVYVSMGGCKASEYQYCKAMIKGEKDSEAVNNASVDVTLFRLDISTHHL